MWFGRPQVAMHSQLPRFLFVDLKWQNQYAVQTKTTIPFLIVRASCRTDCKRTVPDSLKLSRFEPTKLVHLACHVWPVMLEKYRKLHPKPKTTDELAVVCRPSRRSSYENTLTKHWQTSPSDWLPTWRWLPMMVTSSICSNSVHLQVCILISSSTNQLKFRATNRLPVKTTLGTLGTGSLG